MERNPPPTASSTESATPAAPIVDPINPPNFNYQHPQGTATVTFRGVSKVLPLSRLTTFGLAEEFGVDTAQFPYLKTATSVHEPLNESDGILYGLLDGAHYKLVLGDRTGTGKNKKKQVAPSLRGVQRVTLDQTSAPAAASSLLEYPPPFADDDDDSEPVDSLSHKHKTSFYTPSSIDLEVPPPKRLKVAEGQHATPSTSMPSSSSAGMEVSSSVGDKMDVDLPDTDVAMEDDAEADEALEEVVSELTLEQILERVNVDRRQRMAPSEIQALYEFLRPDPAFRMAPQPPVLLSQLFPYQLSAVAWMVDRELQGQQLSAGIGATNGQLADFPELAAAGGILADEVGLGKTLETLGLILSNPMPKSTSRKLKSLNDTPTIPATLVVAPPFLLKQWEQEIHRHCAGRLNVFAYDGMNHIRKLMGQYRLDEHNSQLEPDQKKRKRLFPVSDAELASYIASGTVFDHFDIVLTSYDVMREEVWFDGAESRKLRSGALFRAMSPLRSVRWWRVCMDEVQEIKGAQSQAARMCRELPAVHRWGISGTPIKHTFQDIFGLLVFLGIDDALWKLPVSQIVQRMRPLVWRHAQHHVVDHLNIPPLKEITIDAQRTPFETYCKRKLQSRIPDLPPAFWAKFDSAPFDVTFNHLILRPGQRRNKEHTPNAIDFDFMWTSIVNLCTTEFRATHVRLAEALTDLAVFQLRQNSSETALASARDNVRVALDLMLHREGETFDRLIDLRDAGFQMEALTTPAAQLIAFRAAAVCVDISKAMGREHEAAEATALVDGQKSRCLADALTNWNRTIAKFKKHRSEAGIARRNRLIALKYRQPWWQLLVRWLREESPGHGETLITKLRTGFSLHVDTKLMGGVETWVQFPDANLNNLEDIMTSHIDQLDSLRSQFVKKVMVHPPTELSDLEAFETQTFPELERLLSAYSDHQVMEARSGDGIVEHRKRSISRGEILLLTIEGFINTTYNEHFHEYTKKTAQGEPISDDLLRRVDFLGFLSFEASGLFRELELNKLELLEGYNILNSIRHCLSILAALREVVELDSSSEHTCDEEILLQRVEQLHQRCLLKRSELRFLGKNSTMPDPSADRFGSKQSKGIKRLRNELLRAPEQKALVFSAHAETITQFSHLLGLGYSPFKYVGGRGVQTQQGKPQGSFVSRIKDFQDDPEIRVLMLSALKQSTGLTLTNANHVLLLDAVEPGDEQQAIGRVRRIGQTRVTHIYKFTMKEHEERPENPIPSLSDLRQHAEAEQREKENADKENPNMERLRQLFDV